MAKIHKNQKKGIKGKKLTASGISGDLGGWELIFELKGLVDLDLWTLEALDEDPLKYSKKLWCYNLTSFFSQNKLRIDIWAERTSRSQPLNTGSSGWGSPEIFWKKIK